MNIRKIDTFSGHRDCVYTLISDHTPQGFYSAGGDGLVVKWDLQRPDLGEVVARLGASVYALAYHPEEHTLWIGQNFEGIQKIDPAGKAVIASLKLSSVPIFDIQFFGEKAWVAQGDGVIVVLDVPSFSVQKHIKASAKSVRTLAVNPATGEIAAGFSDWTVSIFDADGFLLKKTLRAHDNSVFTVRYSPDGRYLLTAGRDAHLKVWDVQQGYELREDIPAHLFAINHLTYSPDGRWLATGSMDKSIKVWDAGTFRLRKVIDRARHAGHGTSVNKLLWKEHQNRLVSCSDDRMISVWEVE
ncbi:hypothetical protein GCM10027275_36320 [Rhabdobacter roseus]|uniref:WD40 repeat protein n=1 Tax=Rhabdobacter roseus TaxID=1655419 RepID=A0A840TQ67_9BACT|nr:cytochrome D1 domain-containing protein [Rhabdobacter roseus]MBB5285961.1 WD40 repeat protein [Rhabdobacter roseus]